MTIEGWKKAIDLKVGEKIITFKNIQNIENIQKVSYNKNIAVYNLEVEENHTFFVGNSSILVHNEYKMPNLKKMYKEYLGKLPEGVDRKKFENLLNKVEKSGDVKLLEELEIKLSNLNGDFSKFDKVVKDFDLTLTERAGNAVEKVKYGEQYTKVKGKKSLKANVEYETGEGYKYITDTDGRISKVEANLELGKADRNSYAQRVAGREDRLPNDDGGHLIASIFNGSGDLDNLVPMNSTLNRGEYKVLENTWRKALNEISPKKVEVKIKPIYEGASLRPVRFKIDYKIDGVKYSDILTN